MDNIVWNNINQQTWQQETVVEKVTEPLNWITGLVSQWNCGQMEAYMCVCVCVRQYNAIE